MVNVLIVEDERLAADKLTMLLSGIDTSLRVKNITTSIDATVKWLSSEQPDLIFMDINLADGLCFSIFERVMVTSPVIFITAYDQYAIKAFKHNGIDYILKPIDEIELRASVERYRKSEQRQDKNMAFRNLLREYWSASRFRERILVQSGVVSKSIATNDVAYFYAFEKGTFLADFSDAHALASETLDKLEMELNPNQFFRVNRKLIVNINSIKEVHKYSLRQLELKLVVQCRVKPVVPAEKLMAFKNWLGGIPTTTP